MINIPEGWTARDCRQFIALTLLAAGAIPLTAGFSLAQWSVHMNPANARAERLGHDLAVLIGVDLFGVSAILGRRLFKIRAGDKVIELSGEDADRVLAQGDAV
jgi:hypothetical protein